MASRETAHISFMRDFAVCCFMEGGSAGASAAKHVNANDLDRFAHPTRAQTSFVLFAMNPRMMASSWTDRSPLNSRTNDANSIKNIGAGNVTTCGKDICVGNYGVIRAVGGLDSFDQDNLPRKLFSWR